jgi:histidyl-tRNA synthetase
MSLPIQPYKGARDFYPEDKRVQKYMFGMLRRVVEGFGYQEYDAPILEPVDIYLAKTGEEIVNEQLYSFEDKGGRKLAIRPEMTPTVSRMVAARRQELAYPLRLYSIPNLWRYERPQAGRLREHWQLNVDLFGVAGIEADHEIILVADSILKAFGAKNHDYIIRISSRELVEHFLHGQLGLAGRQSLDVQKLIDRRHKMPPADFAKDAQELLGSAERARQLAGFVNCGTLDELPADLKSHESVSKLKYLLRLLAESGVETAVFDTSIVRGMEYYTDIVFEVFDTDPANTRSMFGGGRYDGLVGLFGVEPVPTAGFGMGDVTLLNFLKEHGLIPGLSSETDAIAILVGDTYQAAQPILSKLRAGGLNLAVDSSGRKLDIQIRQAAKSGVRYVVFIGESELKSGKFKLRDLKKGEETSLDLDMLAERLRAAPAS